MGELSEFATWYAERRRAEQQSSAAREQERRRVARERAHEFVGIMQSHNIPQIALCGTEHVVEGGARRLLRMGEKVVRAKRIVLMMGWVAVEKFSNNDYDDFGIFLNENAEAYLCKTPSRVEDGIEFVQTGKGYLADLASVGHWELSQNKVADGMADRLMKLGLV